MSPKVKLAFAHARTLLLNDIGHGAQVIDVEDKRYQATDVVLEG